MKSYVVTRIGENKGQPRIWVEGKRVASAGFSPGTHYSVEASPGRLTLTVKDDGTRVVSIRKRGDRELPIIDLNSQEISKVFGGLEVVRVVLLENAIHILPLATELKRQEREERVQSRVAKGQPILVGSLSHGGGVLSHAIHEGFLKAGVPVALAFANDIRDDLLEHASHVNDAWNADTMSLSAPMQQLAVDRWAMQRLPKVDIIECGIPCSGASSSGRAKRHLSCAESHPEVGHLIHAFLSIVEQVNPAFVLVENVPNYSNTASAWILRHQLRDLGYTVTETEVRGSEWGALEDRKRFVLLGVSSGLSLSLDDLVAPMTPAGCISDILDPIALDDPRWSLMPGLKAKQERDIAAGKGFRMQVMEGVENRIPTLTKGLAKNRSTDPKIRHPTQGDLLRIPTPAEHARCKLVPERLIEGLCETTAHELLGQSVIAAPFKALGEMMAQCIRNTASVADMAHAA